MIEVHHLENSRSQRVLWLLEELGIPYEVVVYKRDPVTNFAPDTLRAIHPLGKSPMIRDGSRVVIESGAILEYLVRTYGDGRLAPKESDPDYWRYVQLLHYAEGSGMLPFMLRLYAGRVGDAAAPVLPRILSQIELHLGFLEGELVGRDWFVGDSLTAADVNLSFVFQIARRLHGLDKYPGLVRFLERVEARPAWKRALERGGPYAY
jgi:glutathione S-transferase